MSDNVNEIEQLEFERTFQLIESITANENHFNNLCSKYKTLASTWLLSIFGAIGFVLINKLQPLFLILAGIGFAGCVGILLIWLTDIRVYQQLLAANFVEGLKLERNYQWLPQIRHNMSSSMLSGSVSSRLSWYYIMGIILPFLIGSYAISKYLLLIQIEWYLIIAFILAVVYAILVKTVIEKSEEISLRKENYLKRFKEFGWQKNLVLVLGLFIPFVPITELAFKNTQPSKNNDMINTMTLEQTKMYLAPDGSEIRQMLGGKGGNLAHCILPPKQVSQGVKHKTIEELWYVIEGEGEMWRKDGDKESIVKLLPNTCLKIEVGTSFQFRNTGDLPLKIVLVSMPPWPGAEEAIPVKDYWK